jgi:hypothetical protein
LNCIGFLAGLARIACRGAKGFNLAAIFDFPGGLVHGWYWNTAAIGRTA